MRINSLVNLLQLLGNERQDDVLELFLFRGAALIIVNFLKIKMGLK
jgi:hypothetical protein